MNEEITKAQSALRLVKKRELEEKKVAIPVNRNTSVMMKPNASREEIQAKINQYKQRR